jgi:hypothetical protein
VAEPVKKQSEILVGVKELLSDPKRWTQGVIARKSNNQITYPSDPEATCFCLAGALKKVIGAIRITLTDVLLGLRHAIPESSSLVIISTLIEGIAKLNDSSTHEEIMKLLHDALNFQLEIEAEL